MKTKRVNLKLVCLKGELYVFGGWNDNYNWTMSVENIHRLLIHGIK